MLCMLLLCALKSRKHLFSLHVASIVITFLVVDAIHGENAFDIYNFALDELRKFISLGLAQMDVLGKEKKQTPVETK